VDIVDRILIGPIHLHLLYERTGAEKAAVVKQEVSCQFANRLYTCF